MDTKKKSPCPCMEELSSWFDQEIPKESFANHIQDCDHCQNILADFQRIEHSLAFSEVDNEILSRIHCKCMETTEKPNFILVFPWLKLAASIVLLTVIFFVSKNVDFFQDSRQTASRQANRSQEISFQSSPPPPLHMSSPDDMSSAVNFIANRQQNAVLSSSISPEKPSHLLLSGRGKNFYLLYTVKNRQEALQYGKKIILQDSQIQKLVIHQDESRSFISFYTTDHSLQNTTTLFLQAGYKLSEKKTGIHSSKLLQEKQVRGTFLYCEIEFIEE